MSKTNETDQLHVTQTGASKAILLALDLGRYDVERSIEELASLAQACGYEAVGEIVQKRSAPDAATALGIGRLSDAKELAENLDADVAIFDGELSGSQIRNLENVLKTPVIDRTMLILEIFSSRAVTSEGMLQTELATLEYRLPRLVGLGSSMSRQAGGGGGGGGARRGGGEQKLEYDRRHVRNRIAFLKKRLEAMETVRDENRKARQENRVPLVAVVGYTNVGKSSLVNALTGSSIGAANMLFATLDPTARQLNLDDGQQAVIIDTVGFVSRLPHNLVEAFKSTLEEAKYADLLIVVCDASQPEEMQQQQLEITEEVLFSLGISSEKKLIVYNKCDLVDDFDVPQPTALAVSAHTGYGLDELKRRIGAALAGSLVHMEVLLPYDQLHLSDVLRRNGRVNEEKFRNDGVYYDASVAVNVAYKFQKYLHKEEVV